MRRKLRRVIEGTRDRLLSLHDSGGEGGLSNEEALDRYREEHRGKPQALIQFARLVAGEDASGQDVLRNAVEYEEEMEQMLREDK